jgi:hypothetical protein
VRIKSAAESFYYFGARLVDVLEHEFGGDKVRRNRRTNALIGVVMVRNKLNEHADQPDGVMAINWEFDTPKIVRLKPFGHDT